MRRGGALISAGGTRDQHPFRVRENRGTKLPPWTARKVRVSPTKAAGSPTLGELRRRLIGAAIVSQNVASLLQRRPQARSTTAHLRVRCCPPALAGTLLFEGSTHMVADLLSERLAADLQPAAALVYV
jgi:hypothetical protein